jgi:hypothetical protein
MSIIRDSGVKSQNIKAIAIIGKRLDDTYGVFIGSDNVPFVVDGDGKTIAEAMADLSDNRLTRRKRRPGCY